MANPFVFFTNQLHSPYKGHISTIKHHDTLLSYEKVIDLWIKDDSFCEAFSEHIAKTPYIALRWETPAVTQAALSRAFEFVIVDDPDLDGPADHGPFDEHFKANKHSSVLTYPNLGGDSIMVVPRPLSRDLSYPHLASFVRAAPLDQQRALWRAVGDALTKRIGARPVWLSTAGGGVSWLHVRMDDRPKYYRYRPYKDDTPSIAEVKY
eukprot:TRINITY_DN145_c1_g1_i1.p1 TRINITY_DN145_c1_g1~~TRINITY_DN145_c1_g1_i1.p1  ORF type:complete len:240 (+),score=31.99 TRINITY_DN145_c1_g1_i1:97-720(+)